MLQYLLHVDKSIEMKSKIAAIDEAVETQYDGSRTHKDVQILVRIKYKNVERNKLRFILRC